MFDNFDLKDVVIVTSSASGYYSGAYVGEYALLPKKLYEEKKDIIDNFKHSYYELDGKHSETDANIDIKINLTIEEFNHLTSSYADMNCLIDVLADKLGVDSRNLSDFKHHFEQHILSINKQLNPDDLALVESVNKLDLKVIAELINNQKVIEHLKSTLK